ncbi:MAG: MarR family transcriptional regulator [Chloroflexi bacterium]|nr:MarR family transcriptional regulator [Chloroflexota bacterium]
MAEEQESSQALIERVVRLFGEVLMHSLPQDMEAMLKLDLTMPQLKVLMVLLHGGPASVGALASALRVTLPTMTGILDRLVEHGMVQRYESPEDRRLVMNRLTDEGAAAAGKLRQVRLTQASNILRRLPIEDLEKLANSLEKLRSAAELEG